MMRNILIALMALVLGSCAGSNIQTTHTPLPASNSPQAQPMTLNGVQWQVLNRDDIRRLAQQLATQSNASASYYVLDNNNFEAMMLNLEEMKRYILEQNQVILFYQDLQKAN